MGSWSTLPINVPGSWFLVFSPQSLELAPGWSPSGWNQELGTRSQTNPTEQLLIQLNRNLFAKVLERHVKFFESCSKAQKIIG